jgi:hypothetical protein
LLCFSEAVVFAAVAVDASYPHSFAVAVYDSVRNGSVQVDAKNSHGAQSFLVYVRSELQLRVSGFVFAVVFFECFEDYFAEASGSCFSPSDFGELCENVDLVRRDAEASDDSDSSMCI